MPCIVINRMTNSTRIICPYCGAREPLARCCGSCGGLLDPASRAATAQDVGPWYVRDESRPFFPGCSDARLKRMVRDGLIQRNTILRGPTTDGFWLPASRVPGVARMLGVCHGCSAMVGPESPTCGRCGVPLSFEHNQPAVDPAAGDPSGASAVELIKHAQYRHISRLQLIVRLQGIGLAILCGALFIGVVAWLVGLLEESDPIEPAATAQVEPLATTNDAGLLDVPVEPEIPLRDPDEVATDPLPDPPPSAEESSTDDLRDQVVEELNRDVTADQAALITRLGTLLDRASARDLPSVDRSRAIDEAFGLIDEALVEETNEIMRYRLQALRGEFDEERRRLAIES